MNTGTAATLLYVRWLEGAEARAWIHEAIRGVPLRVEAETEGGWVPVGEG